MKPATKTWAELVAEWERDAEFAQLVKTKLQEYRQILAQQKVGKFKKKKSRCSSV